MRDTKAIVTNFYVLFSPNSLGWFLGVCKRQSVRTVGVLCDRFNHCSVAVSGSLIATAALAVTSQAPNLTTMYSTFDLIFGFGSCCIFFFVLIIMPRYFIKRRSLAAGLVLMGPGGGLIVMSPIIQALLSVSTWRVTFLVMAGMLVIDLHIILFVCHGRWKRY